VLRLFWNSRHLEAWAALLALLLPRRLPLLRALLAAPYARRLVWRRSGPLLAPYVIAYDVVELATFLRGSLRYGTLVL